MLTEGRVLEKAGDSQTGPSYPCHMANKNQGPFPRWVPAAATERRLAKGRWAEGSDLEGPQSH